MKFTKTILVLAAALTLSLISGCNSGGGRVRVLPVGDNFALLEAELDPTGVNINDKNTTELLTVVREDQLQDTVVQLTKGKKPVITTPEQIQTATGTASLMGNAFGPRPQIVKAK